MSTVNALEGWEPALDQLISELEPRLIETRRHLHAHPEPSGEERETSQFLHTRLREAGISARLGRNGLGVIADLDVGEPAPDAPRIAIRADIDALRIQDAKSTAYASTRPGLCHACGHDAHTAIALGAALCSLAAHEGGHIASSVVPGLRLRFIFQPAEESAEGALWMVEQGAVDQVSAILGLHVDPERQLGAVGIRYGVLTANCDEVEVVIEGKGGHSARPHHTLDPIAAAAQLVTSLYQYLPRSVDARNPSVFSIGKIAGGTLPNVIPSRVEILGSLRTLDQQVRRTLKDRIQDIVHGVKESSGTAVHLRFFEPIDSVVNDDRVTAAMEAAARRVLGDDGIIPIHLASMGGEDFSAYLTRVPGAMLRLGIAPPGFSAPFLHATDFDIDERALAIGARILLRTAVLLTADPGKLHRHH
ncbi:MAG: amidohydrolase [Planctomycetaceae bacterium]|nr:amidohydrolase [Planctomycetaceae bacterium]